MLKKLQLNSENTQVEIESERECIVTKHQIPVTEAYLPNGKKIKMLKSMLTSACENNCYYCAFRSGRDVRRATFKPDDFANIFMQIYQRGLTQFCFCRKYYHLKSNIYLLEIGLKKSYISPIPEHFFKSP